MKIINWFQIPAENLERAVKFYSEVFRVSFHQMEYMGEKHAFFALDTLDTPGTGGEIVQSSSNKPSRFGPLIFLNTPDSIDELLTRVIPAGGSVAMPKTSIGENGIIAAILDSEGNRIGVHSR